MSLSGPPRAAFAVSPAASQPLRVLAIDDTPGILADYRRILCSPPTPAGVGDSAATLDALEADLFETDADDAGTPAFPAFELATAPGGAEGLAAVEAAVAEGRPFGVAFVDMRMPGGWDGTRTIRALLAADPALQVVVATAYSDRSLDVVCAAFRKTDQLLILKKPFDAVEVRQAAAALAVKRRMTEEASLRLEELDRRVAERTRQIRQMALCDGLTGLPNRQALLERLEHLVADEKERRLRVEGGPVAPRNILGFALLFLDFNRFKLINDSLGHEVGDRLLRSIAGRIRRIEASLALGGAGEPDPPVHGGVTGYRIGGDEFVLLLEGVPSVGAAGDVALEALERFADPHDLGPHRCVSTASIGLASSFRDDLDAAELLRDADLAMFEAKAQGRESGRAVCVAYDGAMHAAARRRLTLENDLRAAIDGGTLDLRFQPIRDAADAGLLGAEALLSWVHPRLGRVDNREIIGVAEESDLIHPLGVWVRDAALRAARRFGDAGPGGQRLPVHVNASMRELLAPGFADGVLAQVDAAGLGLDAIVLEISEAGIDRQSEPAAEAIRGLARCGFAVVLDDFGRERCSLAFLAGLPLRAVKIDRFFTADATEHPERLQVLQAIAGFTRSLGLSATACGIENPEQLAAAQSVGLDGVEGWLIGRPMPLEGFVEAERLHACLMGGDAGWARAA